MKVRNFHISPHALIDYCIRDYAKRLTEKKRKLDATAKRVSVTDVIEMMTVETLSSTYPDLKKFYAVETRTKKLLERKKRTTKKK